MQPQINLTRPRADSPPRALQRLKWSWKTTRSERIFRSQTAQQFNRMSKSGTSLLYAEEVNQSALDIFIIQFAISSTTFSSIPSNP